MATNNLSNSDEELPLNTTGEPTDQLAPGEDDGFEDGDEAEDDDDTELNSDLSDFDNEPMDDDEDLDEDEVKRLFPGEDTYSGSNENEDDEEPYEGIRHGDEEDEGLVDDNMSGMPVIPSPS